MLSQDYVLFQQEEERGVKNYTQGCEEYTP